MERLSRRVRSWTTKGCARKVLQRQVDKRDAHHDCRAQVACCWTTNEVSSPDSYRRYESGEETQRYYVRADAAASGERDHIFGLSKERNANFAEMLRTPWHGSAAICTAKIWSWCYFPKFWSGYYIPLFIKPFCQEAADECTSQVNEPTQRR